MHLKFPQRNLVNLAGGEISSSTSDLLEILSLTSPVRREVAESAEAVMSISGITAINRLSWRTRKLCNCDILERL